MTRITSFSITGTTKSFRDYTIGFIGFFAFFLGNLNGATIIVHPGDDIQAAIDGASCGDTIQILAGTYVQEFEINSINLNIVGAGIGSTIIQSPSSTGLINTFTYAADGTVYRPIIMVENSTVNIQNITVDGNNQGDIGSAPRFAGIGYHNSGGTVSNVYVTNIQDSSYPIGYQEGYGILAVGDSGTNAITIENCTVDNFQKSGILTIGANLTFNVEGNTVTGNTPASPANANGIELYDGATGVVQNNTVTNLIGSSAASCALLAFDAVNLTITNNTISASDEGIYCFDCGDNLTISANTSSDNNDAGITIYNSDTSGVVSSNIIGNTVTDNVNAGIYLYSAVNDTVSLANNNFVNGEAGLIVEGSGITGPVVTMDGDSFTGTAGYYIQEIAAPNDIWPSTSNVSFDGLISGSITHAQFEEILAKIYDAHNDMSLGLVLDFIPLATPIAPANFVGMVRADSFLQPTGFILEAKWEASTSPFITHYVIYFQGNEVARISADAPLVYVTDLAIRSDAKHYKIAAVNADHQKSEHLKITIE